MSETTTSATKAVEKTVKAVAAASQTLPTVVETAELALEVPTKVLLNQRLIVVVSVASGAAAGVAGLWVTKKVREKLAVRKLKAEIAETDKVDEES